MEKIRNFRELRVYQSSIEAAMEIFEITRNFPTEEKYSMVDKFAVLRVLYVPISQKRGENVFTKLILSAN